MIKFKAVAATTNLDSAGNQFTVSALRQLAQTAINKPITISFDQDRPIGRVMKACVKDCKLLIEGELDSISRVARACPIRRPLRIRSTGELDSIPRLARAWVIPGFRYDRAEVRGKITVFDEVWVVAFGYTLFPSEKRLPPIELLCP